MLAGLTKLIILIMLNIASALRIIINSFEAMLLFHAVFKFVTLGPIDKFKVNSECFTRTTPLQFTQQAQAIKQSADLSK